VNARRRKKNVGGNMVTTKPPLIQQHFFMRSVGPTKKCENKIVSFYIISSMAS